VVVLDPGHELQRRLGQLDGGLGALELRAVDDVGPAYQLVVPGPVPAEVLLALLGEVLGAAARLGIEELVGAGMALEVLLVGGRGEGRDVVVEPPGELFVRRVAEVDHHVDVAVEAAGGVDVAGAVALAHEVEGGARVDAVGVEAAEQGRRGGSVETIVVEQHLDARHGFVGRTFAPSRARC
jgi:hypothetical protein